MENIETHIAKDKEILENPTHFTRGLDFNIKKTSKGGYADYSTSNWARRETTLTEADLRIMKEMFEASVDGQPYDLERWGSYYRPYGLEAPAGSTAAQPAAAPAVAVSAPATQPVAEAKQVEPWEEDAAEAAAAPVVIPPTAAGSDKANDILAMIRARQNKSA